MIGRRNFLLSGCFAGAFVIPRISIGRMLLPEAGVLERARFYTLIFDERSPAGRAFGLQGRRRGFRVSPIGADVTRLWYDDLYYRWQSGPAAIAGMTSAGAFFCLETLGNDVGLRRAFATEHASSPLITWALVPVERRA